MLARWKADAKSRFGLLIDAGEVAVLALGSGLSLIFGKLLAALVFAVLAIGAATRFQRRHSSAAVRIVPLWGHVLCSVIAIVATGAIVEAINLPVRFDQAGFEKTNLLVVVVSLLAFYGLARLVLRRVLQNKPGTTMANREPN